MRSDERAEERANTGSTQNRGPRSRPTQLLVSHKRAKHHERGVSEHVEERERADA